MRFGRGKAVSRSRSTHPRLGHSLARMKTTGMETHRLLRGESAGRQWVKLSTGAAEEAFVTLPTQPGEGPAGLFQRLYEWLAGEPHWRVLRQDVFGVLGDDPASSQAKAYRLDGSDWPVTWVEQGNGQGSPVAGVQVHGMSGVTMTPVRHGGRAVGMVYEDEWARHCVLGGLRPSDGSAGREAQAVEALQLMEKVLHQVDMSFTDVYRTWFYLDDILVWYDEFNAVRNDFFKARGVFDGLVPASTGIGGSNAAGTAVVADLLAVQPKSPEFKLRPVPSPLQCPALEYGSSFSRAVEVTQPGLKRLLLSGTASIEPGGATAHVGDVAAQVKTTMEVVHAILESCGMGWQDSVRAIAYFKHAADMPALERYCRTHSLPKLPVIVTKNDVCRDDLLFELEVDTIKVG